MYYFNSRNTFFKQPFGAVKETTTVTFTVTSDNESVVPVLCIAKEGGREMRILMNMHTAEDGTKTFTADYTFDKLGLYFYCFKFDSGKYGIYNAGKGDGYMTDRGPWFMQTVYAKNFSTPDKFKGGIMYQIFPDRFYESKEKEELTWPDRVYRRDKDGQPFFKWGEGETELINTDYYGGDLKGITQKLDYLKGLGVTCIYLNPIFEAHANHRYNTADYMKVDPDLGTMEDFTTMCSECHKRGISVILDGVFSHTGSDSVYFNKEGRYGNGGAYHDPESPYRAWFDFDKRYDHGYRSWWGFPTLPDVDELNKDYLNYICGKGGVINYWLKSGADGFRLDVADELPDEFIEKVRRSLKQCGKNKLLIGEVWEDAVTKISYNKRRSYLLGKGLDSTMNYPFRVAVLDFIKNGDGHRFCESIFSIYENYPKEALDNAWNFISTHDTPRGITYLMGKNPDSSDRYWQSQQFVEGDDYKTASKMLVCAYALMFGLPGVPCIYYGDEIGMQGYRDPFNRGYYKWWDQDEYILKNIKWLANFRKSHHEYREGGLFFVHVSHNAVAYVRYEHEDEVLTAVNRGNGPETFTYKGKQSTIPALNYINAVIE